MEDVRGGGGLQFLLTHYYPEISFEFNKEIQDWNSTFQVIIMFIFRAMSDKNSYSRANYGKPPIIVLVSNVVQFRGRLWSVRSVLRAPHVPVFKIWYCWWLSIFMDWAKRTHLWPWYFISHLIQKITISLVLEYVDRTLHENHQNWYPTKF